MAYTFQAITRHNPDRMKAHATEAMPLAFLAMHEAKTESNTDILEVYNHPDYDFVRKCVPFFFDSFIDTANGQMYIRSARILDVGTGASAKGLIT